MQSATVTNASSSSLEDDCDYNSSSSDYKFTTYEKKLLQTSQSSSNVEMSDWISDSENKTSKLNKTKKSKKIKTSKKNKQNRNVSKTGGTMYKNEQKKKTI